MYRLPTGWKRVAQALISKHAGGELTLNGGGSGQPINLSTELGLASTRHPRARALETGRVEARGQQ